MDDLGPISQSRHTRSWRIASGAQCRSGRAIARGSLPAICAALLLVSSGCRPHNKSAATDDTRVASAALAVNRQEYIWDVEHAAFELEKKFGKSLIAALRQENAGSTEAFFRPGCTASVPQTNQETILDRGYLRKIRSGGDARSANPAELARHLRGYLTDLASVHHMTCRVLDLHADNDDPETGHWRLTLYLSGHGEDAKGELVEFVTHHHLRCAFASDADIEGGRIVEHWEVESEEFRYCHAPLFEEVTVPSGLSGVDIQDNWEVEPDRVRQYFSQMAVEDFDRDGFLDVAVASANGRWRLLHSVDGATYREVNDAARIPVWSEEQPRSRAVRDQAFLATWIDFDNDDFPDLLLGDRLYHNIGGHRFQDVTETSGLIFGYNPKGCVVADYDGDGLLDLYVLYQNPRAVHREKAPGWVGDDESGEVNDLWRNAGGGHFVNVTERSGTGGGRRQSFAAAWFHANDDHYPDLYVANDFGPNTLLINRGDGRFEESSDANQVSDYATSMGVAAGDLTGDGRADLYVANMFSKMGRRIIAHVHESDYPSGVYEQIRGSCAGNRLYARESGQDAFREFSEAAGVNQVGWAYAPALADFDADGLLDIYATTGFLSYRRDKPDG